MSLSIIIPCRDEERSIVNTVNYFQYFLKKIKFEIIIINDFSSDSTLKKLKFLKKKFSNVIYKNNLKKGLGGAIQLGILTSKYKYICITMADRADFVEDLIKYYNLISSNKYHAVFGSRFIRGSKLINYPIVKLIYNRIFNFLTALLFLVKYNDFTNAFKIYQKDVLLEIFPIVSENFNVFLELPLKIISRDYTFKIIPIGWINRKKGKSKFKIKELGSRYIFTLAYCWLEKLLLGKKNPNFYKS